MEDPTDNWPTPISPNDNLPEAPASANVKVWIDGFGCMFTIRGKEVYDVVNKTVMLIKTAKDKGWQSTWDKGTPTTTTKPSQDTCLHEKVGTKEATGHNKPENKGKLYDYCLACNKFMGWAK